MGWCLAAVLVVAGPLLLLAIPVEVTLAAGSDRALRLRLVWLFGLLSVDPVRVNTAARESALPKSPAKGRDGWKAARRTLALLRAPGFLSRLARLLQRLLMAFTVRIHAHAELGLEDPADTGELYGLLRAALTPLQHEALQVELRPNFDEPGLTGQIDALVRFTPLRLVAEAMAFCLSTSTLRALRNAVRA